MKKYNKGDEFEAGKMRVKIVRTTRYGHTTGLEMEITHEGNATVQTVSNSAHRFTRLIKAWGLRRVS